MTSRENTMPARPDRPKLDGPVEPELRAYIVAAEVYATALEVRAWAVAGELRYEQENRAAPEFGVLADELLGISAGGDSTP